MITILIIILIYLIKFLRCITNASTLYQRNTSSFTTNVVLFIRYELKIAIYCNLK